jgi:hypothetical protein
MGSLVWQPLFAVNYAEWVAREMERAEIRVYNRDGSLAERRIVGKAAEGQRPAAKE